MTDALIPQMGTVAALNEAVGAEMSKAVKGQQAIIEGLLICLLAEGHVLLEGVPGTAKTLMARALAQCLQCEFHRVQFTPDLMPSDIIGTTVFEPENLGILHQKRADLHLGADGLTRSTAPRQRPRRRCCRRWKNTG